MFRFETTLPDAADARALLDQYFADRAATRPASLGPYVPASPDPAQFTPPRGVFLVARDEHGAPIACGGVRRVDPGAEWRDPALGGDDWMEVKHVFTAPEARGTGAAGAMMQHLEDAAARLGADRLVLDTSSSLEAAARLYAKRGFERIRPFNDNANADRWFGKRLAGRAT